MWYYGSHEHRLLGENISRDEVRLNGRRFLVGPVVYGVASLVALMVPWVALGFYIALNVFFLWPHRKYTANKNEQ